MALVIVSGVIDALGESTKRPRSGEKVYDYVSVRDATGTSTMIRKLRVPDEIDRILVVGQDSQLFVGRAFRVFRFLLAARVGSRHAVGSAMKWSLPRFYLTIAFGAVLMVGGLLLLGFVMALTIVGLLLVPVLWGMAIVCAVCGLYIALVWPGWRSRTLGALRTAGLRPDTVEV